MTTPVWVITGLLDSGKTTLINQLIEQELDEQDILVIQFESGETPLTEQERVKELVFSKNSRNRIMIKPAIAVGFMWKRYHTSPANVLLLVKIFSLSSLEDSRISHLLSITHPRPYSNLILGSIRQ